MKQRNTIRVLIIGILVLALVSASAMAISKSDLLASYTSQSGNIPSKPIVSPTWTYPTPETPSSDVVEPIPTWTIPTPVPSSGKSYFPSWFTPSSRVTPSIYPTPTPTPTPAPTPSVLKTCPPDVPVGVLHFYDRMRYTDGTYLYGAVDDSGAEFRVGKGCSCNCTYYDLNEGWDVVKTAPCDSLFK
jgi:hypothetical protein